MNPRKTQAFKDKANLLYAIRPSCDWVAHELSKEYNIKVSPGYVSRLIITKKIRVGRSIYFSQLK